MKKIIVLIIATVFCVTCFAKSENDILALNPKLQELYKELKSNKLKKDAEYAVPLKLKFANEKVILFLDGYVQVDKSTKYSFLKFKRGYTFSTELKKGQEVNIKFKILEIRQGETTPGMPYLFVELIKITPNK
jgi:hypothetical protein